MFPSCNSLPATTLEQKVSENYHLVRCHQRGQKRKKSTPSQDVIDYKFKDKKKKRQKLNSIVKMQKAVINASKSCFLVIIRHFPFAKVLRKYWSRFKRKRNPYCLILNFIRKKLYSNIPLFQILKNQSYLKERVLSTSYYLRAHGP